jgi:hypothetical protein
MAMAGYESTAVGIMMPVSRQWPAPAVLDEPPVAVLRLQVWASSPQARGPGPRLPWTAASLPGFIGTRSCGAEPPSPRQPLVLGKALALSRPGALADCVLVVKVALGLGRRHAPWHKTASLEVRTACSCRTAREDRISCSCICQQCTACTWHARYTIHPKP